MLKQAFSKRRQGTDSIFDGVLQEVCAQGDSDLVWNAQGRQAGSGDEVETHCDAGVHLRACFAPEAVFLQVPSMGLLVSPLGKFPKPCD